jgi:hypothetical protein
MADPAWHPLGASTDSAPIAAERHLPLVVATKLVDVLAAAANRGFASFPRWLEGFTRHCWAHPEVMGHLAMPARGNRRRGTVGWMTFPGGSSRRDGDRWRMYRHFVRLLEGAGLLEELSPPDGQAKRCGEWRVLIPVPEVPHGPGETWRILRKMAVGAARPEAALMDVIRRHAQRCTPHLRPRPKDARVWASADHSPRNRHHLDQVRAILFAAALAADPRCTPIANWPDADPADSVDMAVFKWASRSLVMAVKCGLGLPDDPEAEALLHVLESRGPKHPEAVFLYVALWDADPSLVARLEAAGIRVAAALPKRVRPARTSTLESPQGGENDDEDDKDG